MSNDVLTDIESSLERISGTLDIILRARGIDMNDPETWPDMPKREKARNIALLAEPKP